MIMRNQKMAAIVAAVVVVAGVAVWMVSRPAAPPKATFAPGEVVTIEDSEMSPKAFEARRRQMVESRRAAAGATTSAR